MTRAAQVGVVLAGYAAAVAAAYGAAWIYNARVAALPYDTSGGMYAGGEMLQALGAFLVVSLVPTLLALWFLRSHHGFWNAVAVASLVFAAAGLLAVLAPLVIGPDGTRGWLALVVLLALSQLLGMPLWLLAFVLFAFLAPTQAARRKLLAAIGIETAIGACALVHWLLPRPPF